MQTTALCSTSAQMVSAKGFFPFSSLKSPKSGNSFSSSDSRNDLFGQRIVIQTTERRFKSDEKILGGRIYAGGDGEANGNKEKEAKLKLYGKIDKAFLESAKRFQGIRKKTAKTDVLEAGNWEEIEDCWVLKPTVKEPVAVVHFIGGAFVGAAPELTYRLFLETLAERGVTIITTPYPTSFEHFKIADEAQSSFEKCLRFLNNGQIGSLPVFGVGHSLGALTTVLIAAKDPSGSKDAIERRGNVLMSYNNKEVTNSIPHILPFAVLPSEFLGKIFVSAIKLWIESLVAFRRAAFAWKLLRQFPFFNEIAPLLEQVIPLIEAVLQGKIKFNPSPADTDKLTQANYGVKSSLLVKFKDDSIDESIHLEEILKLSSHLNASDYEIRLLSGTHARPIQQVIGEDPQANPTDENSLVEAAKSVRQSLVKPACQKLRESIEEDIESLVDEIAPWMGASRRPIAPKPIGGSALITDFGKA